MLVHLPKLIACGHGMQVEKELLKFLPTLAMAKGELAAD